MEDVNNFSWEWGSKFHFLHCKSWLRAWLQLNIVLIFDYDAFDISKPRKKLSVGGLLKTSLAKSPGLAASWQIHLVEQQTDNS